MTNIKSFTVGLPVTELKRAVEWYRQLLGEVEEVNPALGVWEFQIVPSGWLQLFESEINEPNHMIGNFLWRAFKPGYEWPMRFEQVITIAFDLLCLGSLIGLKIQISRAMRSSDSTWTKGNVLFWIALVAGLGVLAIRLHGDASWWTGHFFEEELRPR